MLWILFGLSFISEVHGFADGYFPQSCQSMSVNHSKGEAYLAPQTSDPPFEVVCPHGTGEYPITVSVRSKSSAKFKGFMLEARRTNDMEGPPVGKFILLDTERTRLLTCNGVEGSAVSKRGSRLYSEMSVNWTAHGEELDMIFRATIVKDFVTFWEKMDCPVLVAPPTTLPPTTSEPCTTTSTTKPATTTEQSTTTSTTKPATTTEQSTTTNSTKPATTTTTLTSVILVMAGALLIEFHLV